MIKNIIYSIWFWFTTVLMVLFGLLKWEKAKNKKLKDEVANKEVDLKIKNFEATEAKLKNEVQSEEINIKPNSDIKL